MVKECGGGGGGGGEMGKNSRKKGDIAKKSWEKGAK